MPELEPGELVLVLEFAQNIKDRDWFGKQDPYCVLICGSHKQRSRTAIRGGKNPVWNAKFRFSISTENSITFVIMDEDKFSHDDAIGWGTICLSRARLTGSDHTQVPVFIDEKGSKQCGILAVDLTFTHHEDLPKANEPHGALVQPSGTAPAAAPTQPAIHHNPAAPHA